VALRPYYRKSRHGVHCKSFISSSTSLRASPARLNLFSLKKKGADSAPVTRRLARVPVHPCARRIASHRRACGSAACRASPAIVTSPSAFWPPVRNVGSPSSERIAGVNRSFVGFTRLCSEPITLACCVTLCRRWPCRIADRDRSHGDGRLADCFVAVQRLDLVPKRAGHPAQARTALSCRAMSFSVWRAMGNSIAITERHHLASPAWPRPSPRLDSSPPSTS